MEKGNFFKGIGDFFGGVGKVIKNTAANFMDNMKMLPQKSELERTLNKFKIKLLETALKLKDSFTSKALKNGNIEKKAAMEHGPAGKVYEKQRKLRTTKVQSKDPADMWSGKSMSKGERSIDKVMDERNKGVTKKVKAPLVKNVSSEISKATEAVKSAPVKAAPIKNLDIGKER